MTQAQVSYTDSCPLVLRYPVTGSLESVRLSSDVRERLIVECFTNNGVAGVKFRGDGEEGWTPVCRRRSRRRKMGPGRTSGDPVDPVTIPDGATVFFQGLPTPGSIFSAAASVYISREHGRLRTTRHFV